jgi:PST family polysaccharide transporter
MKNPNWFRILPSAFRARIEHRYGLQRALANTGWLFGDKIIRMGVGLLVSVWVARYLGPAQFGLFSYATAFVALFGAIASLGLPGIIVRDLVREPENAEEVLGTAFVLQFMSGLLLLVISVGVICWLRPDDMLARMMVAILGSSMVFKAADVAKCWFEAKVQSKQTIIIENLLFLFIAAIKVVLIQVGASLMAFVWVVLIETVLVSVGMLWIYQRRTGALVRWKLQLIRAGHLLKDSWPLILSGLAAIFYLRVDQVMLGQMLNDRTVGIYSAAVRISEVWYFIPYAVSASVFPYLVGEKSHDEENYRRKFQELYDFMVALALMISIPVAIFSKPLIQLLYGDDFSSAASVLTVHVWALAFVFLSASSGKWFIIQGLQKYVFYRAFCGAIVNVLLNLLLIPVMGANGAAIATVLSLFVSGFAVNYFMIHTRELFYMQLKSLTFFRIYKNKSCK